MEKYSDAIPCYQELLVIAKETHNKGTIAVALYNLGTVLIKLNREVEGLAKIEEALYLFKSVGNVSMQVEGIQGLAKVYQYLGKRDLALKCCNRALDIAINLGSPLFEECQKLKADIEYGLGGQKA